MNSKPAFAFFDVETTGFHPMTNSLLTMGMLLTDADYKIIGEFYEECHPGFTQPSYHLGHQEIELWSPDAERVHGISWRDAQRFQPPREFCNKLLGFILPRVLPNQVPIPLVFHANTPFDVRFLFSHFYKWDTMGYYDLQRAFRPNAFHNTMSMAREYNRRGKDVITQLEKHTKVIKKMDEQITKPRKAKVKPEKIIEWETKKAESELALTGLGTSHHPFDGVSLDKICSRLGIPLEHHNALSDAKALIPIHKFLIENLGEPTEVSLEIESTAA